MKIIVLDDEPIALRVSKKIVQEVVPDALITGFGSADEVFDYLEETGMRPDVVFSDIEMPGMSGLDFAVRFKTICPNAVIIFVTAYSQYALEAFRLHVHGYILKPLTADRVREELDYALSKDKGPDKNDMSDTPDAEKEDYEYNPGLKNRQKSSEELIKIRCFGEFEIFWKGMPLMFGRSQTKEMLAYLVDRRGTACTAEEIAAALWKSEDNMHNSRTLIRILINDLLRVLRSIGKEDIIVRGSGKIAINKEAVDCDYYRMLTGDMDAVNAFQGEYMNQYSWAEITDRELNFE